MEHWKPIPGYESLYEASDLGRIKTAQGKTTANARFPARVWKERVLKQKIFGKRNRRDARVELWKDGTHKTFLVSRLVAVTWIGTPALGMTVNHINGNPLDNRVENLEWVSLAENIRHGYQTGLYSKAQKPVTLSVNGSVMRFPSMSSADKFLNRSIGYTSQQVIRGSCEAVSKSGVHYRLTV